MDAVFDKNRAALEGNLKNLRQQQAKLQQMSRAAPGDEAGLFAQIDRVATARADLDRANARMFLQLRNEMDPDQIKKLETKK